MAPDASAGRLARQGRLFTCASLTARSGASGGARGQVARSKRQIKLEGARHEDYISVPAEFGRELQEIVATIRTKY